jgi:hypothetical protein
VIDILYYGLVRNNISDVSKKIIETREMIDTLEM